MMAACDISDQIISTELVYIDAENTCQRTTVSQTSFTLPESMIVADTEV